MAAPSVPEASSAIDAQRSGSAVRGEWVATKRVSPNRNAKAATIPSRCSPAPILTGSSPSRFARTKSVPGWLSTSRNVPGPWARIAPDTPTATAEKIPAYGHTVSRGRTRLRCADRTGVVVLVMVPPVTCDCRNTRRIPGSPSAPS